MAAASSDTRYRFGVALLGLSFVIPLGAIPVAYSDLPTGVKATLMGLLSVGGPEILTVLAVAVLGRENFTRLKDRVFGWLRLLKPAPASRAQYYVGLAMMILPVIPSYVMAYAPRWLPDQSLERLYVNIAADLTFLLGIFVAGGDMWDKIRALFVYDAPDRPATSSEGAPDPGSAR